MRKAYRPVMGVATDGWLILLPLSALIGTVLVAGAWFAAGVLAALALGLLLIFLDPERRIPSSPLGIVSPVDGRISAVAECDDPVLKRKAVAITIEVARFGSYAVRAPSEGLVCAPPARWQGHPTSWIRTDEGDSVLLVCSAGSMGGVPPMRFSYGSRIGQGQRCAPRRLATRFEVVVPAAVRVEVEAGQQVRSGADLLATMIRRN